MEEEEQVPGFVLLEGARTVGEEDRGVGGVFGGVGDD